ncbi:MAG TPA: hypothetical protein VKE51_08105 [Vicinamibacterales bacterium]|nr:hypothetical protein [Vicinamibacterales bacterium]
MPTNDSVDYYIARHLRVGWRALLIFAALGLILESLQGFKVAAYLDVSNETRRLMWRLAHAHGTLLGAINILFALTLKSSASASPATPRISIALLAATLLLPAGFFLGGAWFYSGDPGVGILIVPIGAVLLLVALFWIVRGIGNYELRSKN